MDKMFFYRVEYGGYEATRTERFLHRFDAEWFAEELETLGLAYVLDIVMEPWW